MVKIALVFPRFKYPSGDIPLGISYIAANLLKKTKAEVKIVDTTFFKNFMELESLFKTEKFDYIAISLMTTMLKDTKMILDTISAYNPEAKVIIGGPHATVMPEQTISMQGVDAVALGEGEETLVEVINKNSFENVAGIWFKKNGGVIKNPLRPPNTKLDKIPFPAWELLPLKDYFFYWFQLDSVSKNLKGINILTSRGCPFNCSYCQPTLSTIFGKKIRRRSVKNVIEELKKLKTDYGVNAFMIVDDTFNINKSWVEDFCKELLKQKLNLIWGCNTRANLIDQRLFALMKKSGLRKVFMGVESGSQRVLDEIYQKGITLEQVKNGAILLHQLGLKVQGFFMLGAPTETKQEINKTLTFAKRLDIDEATFSITTPLPKTFLSDKTKEHIKIPIDELDYYKNYAYTLHYSQKEITYLKRKALLSFYLSKKHILSTIKMFFSHQGLKKSLIKLKRF